MAEGFEYTLRVTVRPQTAERARDVLQRAIIAALRELDDDQHLTVEDDGPGDYTRATDPRDNGRNER